MKEKDSNTKFTVQFYTSTEDSGEINRSRPFMINDIIAILQDRNIKAAVIYISNYYGNDKYKKFMFNKLVDAFKFYNDVVICTSASVFIEDFPETEYYDPNDKNCEDVGDKKPVPFDEEIERQSKIIESAGFVDFNFYVNYEFSKAYIYPNKLGKKILDICKDQIK